MDIQAYHASTKTRKGSCSTIESTYSDPSSPDDRLRPVQKQKKVRKVPKLKKSSSSPPSAASRSQYNLHNELIKQNQVRIVSFVKQISRKFNFHADTYLVCLKISSLLRFEGEAQLCPHVALSICYMVQKLYETCWKVSYSDILGWSGNSLVPEIYAQTEAAILEGLNYELPSIEPEWSEKQIQQQINRIQAIYQN